MWEAGTQGLFSWVRTALCQGEYSPASQLQRVQHLDSVENHNNGPTSSEEGSELKVELPPDCRVKNAV